MSRAALEERLSVGVSAVQSRLATDETVVSASELAETLKLVSDVLRQVEAERQTAAKRVQWLQSEQSRLEERMSRLENGLLFRSLRRVGGIIRTSRLKLGQTLLASPLHPLYLNLTPWSDRNRTYEDWLARLEAQTPSWNWHRDTSLRWLSQPLISILMPVHNPRRDWLEAAVKSVLGQSYPFWELCLSDDSSQPWVAEYFDIQARQDPRIRYCVSRTPLGIAAALNHAGEIANGEYVGFLDHDDVLAPLALHHIVEALQEGPADVLYSDEDHLDPSGRRTRPSFKPDWSPDLLTSCMYWGHFLIIARRQLDQIGWFRSEYDGAQDYDVALRITDQPATVRHVPRVLYHWRQHEGSTALRASAKPYANEAGRRALEDAIRRRKWDADLTGDAVPNTYCVRRALPKGLRISFIICTRTGRLLNRCLRALEKARCGYESELVVVQHETGADDGVAKVVRDWECEAVTFRAPFNFARMNNLGVAASHGDVLLFLNDDVVSLSPDWLDYLLAHLQRPEVGIVGPKLVYRSGAIQHAGIVLGMMEGTGHPGRGLFQSDLWRWLDQTRNVSAVTGACMGVRRTVFLELGGLNEDLPVNYNDVDLCLRARRAGYEVIYEPHALLRHDECGTRTPGTNLKEREWFHQLWSEYLDKPDPYFSPLLSRDTEEIRLA